MNIGFVVNNIAVSEINYELISCVNQLADKDTKTSPYIFFQNISPTFTAVNCMTMNIVGINGFQGKLVAFDLESANIINKNNQNSENYFYLTDLEWLTKVVNYTVVLDILNNFKIYVRSEYHRNIVKNFTGREDIEVMESVGDLVECLISNS